jgi:hypothetical protein
MDMYNNVLVEIEMEIQSTVDMCLCGASARSADIEQIEHIEHMKHMKHIDDGECECSC